MEPKSIPTANDILLANYLPKSEPQAPPVVEPSTETPSNAPVKVEPQTPATPEAVTTEISIDDWDSTPEPTPEPKVEPKAEKPKEPESKPPVDEWAGIDEKLKKAVEYAKKGGDYLTYLGIHKVDYSKIDPVELYKQSIMSMNLTPEEKKELLESTSPLQMKAEGVRLQAQYTQWQNQQAAEYESSLKQAEFQQAERKARADKELRSTLDKVDKIAGLSLKAHQKQDIYDAITTGRMQRELFYSKETGDYDYQSMIETYFVKKNLPKIIDHIKKITTSDTLRQHIKETSNVNLEKSRQAPDPEPSKPSNPLDDFINRSRTQGVRK